jgi:reticulon-4-interacting protein 1, mitochondrial
MATASVWKFTQRGVPRDVLHLEPVDLPILPPPPPLPTEIPVPEEWLFIKVSYTALNPGSQMQMNILPAFARASPSVPEMDFSGTVLDVWVPGGSTPARFVRGDEIVGFIPIRHGYPTGNGALASHLRIPARYVVKKPANTSLQDCAGLMCAGCAAWTLVNEAHVKTNQRVLVIGASGGVGTSVVQLVKHVVGSGGVVVGVCSGINTDMVRTLGADEVSLSCLSLLYC